jgi:hypothetical protein
MVVLGALVTSAFFGAGQRNRIAAAALLHARAQAALNYIEAGAFASAASLQPDSLSVGDFAEPVNHVVSGVESAVSRIARISARTYMLVCEVRVAAPPRGGITRRSLLFLRLDSVAGVAIAQKVTTRPRVEVF